MLDDDGSRAKPVDSVVEPTVSSGRLPAEADPLSIALLDAEGGVLAVYTFRQAFTAGRAPDNMIVVDDDGVSRHHVEVRPAAGRWRIRDLGSANGVFIDDRRIENEEELVLPAHVALGGSGAWLRITRLPTASASAPAERAGSSAVGAPAGYSGSEPAPQRPLTADPATAFRAEGEGSAATAGRRTSGAPADPGSGIVQAHGGPFAEILAVTVLAPDGSLMTTFELTGSFSVGRAPDNTIVLDDAAVSRRHLEVSKRGVGWQVIDLGSANGVYLNDALIERAAELPFPAAILVGRSGICLQITRSSPAQESSQVALPAPVSAVPQSDHARPGSGKVQSRAPEDIKARLLDEAEAEDSGEYTRIVRRIIREDRVIRKKSYRKVIWVLGVLFGLSICLASYQQFALANTRRLALELFHDIKTLEVSLGQAEIGLEESADTLAKTIAAISSERLRVADEQLKAEREKIAAEQKRMVQERQRLAAMKTKYRQYVEEANSLRLRFPGKRYEEDLIARVASELGESELELPDEFVSEVRKYIKYWQGGSRMQKAIENMEQNNYLPVVAGALKKHGLPLYFIYLPLQESNYDTQSIGPQTRFGIAKGAWQLLPATAQEYGIATGPLADVAAYDDQDARFDFRQATQAGVKYLKRIYSREAQASGLLVMASYNYGDTRVRKMIREMPDDPRERNFWKLTKQYQLPKETHDYVFYILSAAVIGEDPPHFGFKFSPPLLMVAADGQQESNTGRQKGRRQ